MFAPYKTLSSSVLRLRDWQLFLVVHSLFVALALAPFLLGVRLFSGIGLGHAYPFFSFNNFHTLLSGEVFMNRLNFNGFPSFIPIGFALNPFAYLFTALLPPFTDLHWFMFASMVSGGVLCSLFLRRLDISRAGALVGGASYMAGSWWLVVTADYAPSMAMLPLIAWILLESRIRPKRAALLGALLCGYIWLGVNTQVSLMLFSAFGAGALALGIREYSRSPRAALRPLAVLFASVAAGTVLGIPKFLPTFVYGNLSWRAGGLPVTEAAASGLQPLTIVTYLFPYASFPFMNFGGELLQVFIGAFGFAFLLIGIWMAFCRKASSVLRWWVFAYAFVLVLAFDHSPLAALLHSFPPFSYFRGAGRWTMMSSFAAAPIAGMAFDALVNGSAENIRRKLAAFFGSFTAVLCVVFAIGQLTLLLFSDQLILLFQRYFGFFQATLHLTTPLSYFDAFVERRIHELAAHPLILQPRALFPFFSLLVLAIVLQENVWKRVRDKAAMLVCLSLITTALTLIVYDKSFPRSALPEVHPTASFFHENLGTVLGLFSNGTEVELIPGHRASGADYVQWTVANLIPNTNLLYDVHTLDYFDNIAARRPSALAAWVGAQWVPGAKDYSLVAMSGSTAEKIEELVRRKDVLDLQGVRYLTSPFPLPSSFKKVFEARVTSAELPLGIYENSEARPLAYFADSIETMAEEEQNALERVLHGKWPSRRSLLECEPACDPRSPDGKGEVEIVTDTSMALKLAVKTESPQWLVVTLNRLPGWVVLLDGQPIDAFFANGAFFGIPLPQGAHSVELHFSLLEIIREGIRELFSA